jgi:DNA-binding XRE family transcriptional regulator
MPVRRYRKDPRDERQRRADEEVLRQFELGDFLEVESAAEQEALDHVQRRHSARRELVATLGRELGVLRRAHGLTQQQVAHAVGTNKSNISRLESGRYGGLTVERLIAVLDAFQALGQPSSPRESRPNARR